MADKILNQGATSFATPNWGGAALASDDDAIINQPFGLVEAGLDQSALTGLKSFKIKPGATQGQIGGAASLIVNVSGVFSNTGRGVTAYVASESGGSIANLDNGMGGSTFLTGGTATNVVVTGGNFQAAAAAVVTNLTATGGSGRLLPSATAITLCVITGGSWEILRPCTTLVVAGNARVTYDPGASATMTSTVIETYGGNLLWKTGATPTVRNRGGVVDFTETRVEFTPGGTSWTAIGTSIRTSASVSLENLTSLYLSEAPPPIIAP